MNQQQLAALILALGITGGLSQALANGPANPADAGLFQMAEVSGSGLAVANHHGENKCASGKCGSKPDDDKCGTDKCGSGKCGSDLQDW